MWETKRIIELVEAIMRRDECLSKETVADLGYIKEYARAIDAVDSWTAERLFKR
jgi:hypothetical protein